MQPNKRKFLKYKKPLFFAVLAGVLLTVIFFLIKFLLPVYSLIGQSGLNLTTAVSLLTDKEGGMLKKADNRTNMLLLGISGGSHEGAILTDSIIFLSLDFANRDNVIVSVPRDIWLPSLKTKINSTYYYGESKRKGGGITLTKSAVSEIFGIPVHYAALLDFDNFREVIDTLGGIDIEVESAFEDKKFPIRGRENDFCAGDPEFKCRYETVTFEKGRQHMDGEKALKFVRSRNAENGEGNDFSRGKRQQLVLKAFVEKLKQSVSLNNIKLVKELSGEITRAIDTDLKFSEMLVLGKYLMQDKSPEFRQIVMDTGDKQKKIAGILENPPVWQYDGQWVLVPKDTDYDKFREYLDCHLNDPACQIKP